MFKFSLLILSLIILGHVSCMQFQFSVVVEAGSRECFYQNLKVGLDIYFDFQVIQGGEMDVTFWLNTPSNRVLVTEMKKQMGQHHFKTEEDGEYRFCFDNSFSRFASKQVFFYLYSPDAFVDPEFPAKNDVQKVERDELGEDMITKIESFKERFSHVLDNLEQAQRLQSQFRMYEHIDRITMESNFARVNFWSVLNVCLMICVGFVQVIMIRSLFEDKSKIGRVLRGNKASFH